MSIKLELKKLYEKYEHYYESSLNAEKIKWNNLFPLIKKLQKKDNLNVENVGKSIEGRDIYKISMGKGTTKILAWSQMHGDEPTATAMLFDLINFLLAKDEFDDLRNFLLEKISFNFIPLLNPDGAEKYQRSNAINIDINRDALAIQSPESKILWNEVKKVKPEFGFNLHNQNNYYTAGHNSNSAAISFLAPPVDYTNSTNPERIKSMKLIAQMRSNLAEFLPDNIARYDDEYEIRAFGDNLTASGISVVLIESGFLRNDVEMKEIRKLNFIALLSAFYSIAVKNYLNKSVDEYYSIPENKSLLFDLLLRNLSLESHNSTYKIDIGINRDKKYDQSNDRFYYKSKITAIGDLSIFFGIEECNLTGSIVSPTKIFDKEFDSINELVMVNNLIKEGYGIVKINPTQINFDYIKLPINVLPSYRAYSPSIAVDEYANLIITRNGSIQYVVVNGFICDIRVEPISILNGMVIS